MRKHSEITPGNVVALLGLGAGLYVFSKLTKGPTVTPGPELLPPGMDGEDVEPPTMTRQAARILADRVFAAVYAGAGEDEEAIIAAMLPPVTDGDVFLVIEEYGVRTGPWWSPVEYNLPGALRAFLSPVEIARINNDYARRGINVRF